MRHFVLAAALLVLGADVAWSGALRWSTGDSMVVTASGANLMVGTKAVAPLARGTHLRVTEVRGPWIATWVEYQGKRVDGWVWSPYVDSPRTFSYQPQPTTVSIDEQEPYITDLN